MNILLTGLAIQVVSLITFLGTYRYFRYKLSHRRYILDDRHSLVYSSRGFKYFMICAFGTNPRLLEVVSTNQSSVGVQGVAALLLVRAVVRIAIFADGLASSFAQSQITSFLLDDTLVLVATITLAVYPAGRAFGVAWAETSSRTSPDRPERRDHHLPLRLRRHRRNRSYQISKRVISLPYPSPSTSPRFSPGFTPRSGMTPGLPAHPSPRAATAPVPPLTSPRNNPVHQRVPYDASPTQTVPFMVPKESPGLDSTMWMTPVEHGRKRKIWAGSTGQEGSQMVNGDSQWD